MTDVADTAGLVGIVDVVVVLTVVAVAIAWLVSRFVHTKTGCINEFTFKMGISWR